MKVAQWAEIRRLAEIEGLSHRAIARRLRCHTRTVKKALALTAPPDEARRPVRGSRLDPYKARIDALVARYSVPPEFVGQTLLLRANEREVRVLRPDAEVACHPRCYDRGQLLVHPDHQLAALAQRSRLRARDLEATFNSLGGSARQFHLELRRRPLKTQVHLRKVLRLVELFGRNDVLAALTQAAEYRTFDAAYVETLVLQERRRRELPSPVPLRPRRPELLEETAFDEPDPAIYDRLYAEDAEATDTTERAAAIEPTNSSPHRLHSDPLTADATPLPASPNQEPDHA